MKQLLILSGKGGTGKTTIASAFISLGRLRAYADCDVDAPNLHLVMKQDAEPARKDFFGLDKAVIDQSQCIKCDICRQNCRFNAIKADEGYRVDYYACEGCSVCEFVCPQGAISMEPAVVGELMLYAGQDTIFSTAQLKMGSGNSGLLVTEVKKQIKDGDIAADLAIIDGSPGIGCPVIASITGVDMVLIVAEPSISGISDMERIIKTGENFQVKMAVCINKYDTNQNNTEKIETFCSEKGIPLLGKIPFDSQAIWATNSGRSITDIDCRAGHAAKDIFERTMGILFD
ncbi:MAG TPA: ATP-binding protein [Clostridia bacterium]|nr:ATP-binding protein [Clostridia bacterium]